MTKAEIAFKRILKSLYLVIVHKLYVIYKPNENNADQLCTNNALKTVYYVAASNNMNVLYSVSKIKCHECQPENITDV